MRGDKNRSVIKKTTMKKSESGGDTIYRRKCDARVNGRRDGDCRRAASDARAVWMTLSQSMHRESVPLTEVRIIWVSMKLRLTYLRSMGERGENYVYACANNSSVQKDASVPRHVLDRTPLGMGGAVSPKGGGVARHPAPKAVPAARIGAHAIIASAASNHLTEGSAWDEYEKVYIAIQVQERDNFSSAMRLLVLAAIAFEMRLLRRLKATDIRRDGFVYVWRVTMVVIPHEYVRGSRLECSIEIAFAVVAWDALAID